jgi:hypothetical protein
LDDGSTTKTDSSTTHSVTFVKQPYLAVAIIHHQEISRGHKQRRISTSSKRFEQIDTNRPSPTRIQHGLGEESKWKVRLHGTRIRILLGGHAARIH